MIICVDLDKTLLKNDLSISDFTLNTLKKCKQLGHILIINTARNLERTIKITKLINADYTICNAGTQIYDKNLNEIYSKPVDKEVISKVISNIINYCEILTVQTKDLMYTNVNKDSYNRKLFKDNDDYMYESYKLLCYNLTKDFTTFLESYNLEYIRYEDGLWGRISSKDINKFTGLMYILNLNKFNIEDVIYFGDDIGDIPCLENCINSVAMGNALTNVKKYARFVCETNENDGVAQFLNKYFNL